MIKIKILFAGNTLYQLLLFLLIVNQESNDIILLLNENFELNSLKKNKKFIFYFSNNRSIKKKLKYLRNIKIEKIYGETKISQILSSKIDLYQLEDGLGNYTILKNNGIKSKINFFINLIYFFHKSFPFYGGVDKRIKKIYLTGLASIPKEIAHKVELIDLKELWSKKTLEEQNDILGIFSFDLDTKEKIKGRDIILFTQPLSEDNVITEEEKVKIYLKIIKKYPKERLVIKTHPREKTNYKDIFKEYLVLDNLFPFEILNLLDVKFNKAITLFSTAALGLGDGVEVDFYGTEVHPKILQKFGSCNNIMERNCFLKEE